MTHKAGFINIIGHPNVGKSTLMNLLVGEQLSIVTSKAQTTRHRILGIVNEEDFQIVYSDTPGIIDPAYKMQEGMMKFVKTALEDADTIVLMVEVGQKEVKFEGLVDFLNKSEQQLVVVINKIDQSDQKKLEAEVEKWQGKFANAKVIPISALHNFNIDVLKANLVSSLPDSPPYYPKDSLTDKPERFFVEEKVREKILMRYKQEVPYSVEVLVEEFKEEEEIIRIRANIFVTRDSQKGILIGKGGSQLKEVGKEARKDLEAFFQKQIYLNLFVKVNKDWRNNEQQLKRFGYL
ncbi:MAG: GTPase Era [Vicingaceae bacterium]